MMDARFKAPVEHAPRRQRGMSLMEVLVAMAIAMVGVIIMMQVLLTSEERARTTGAGSDALSNGAVMMHLLQRDVMQAGYGINSTNLLGCDLVLPTGRTIPLAPVRINPDAAIIPAGDAHTDTLLVVYGSDNGQPEGNAISSVGTDAYSVQSPGAFSKDDYVVASPGTCAAALTLAKVTGVGGSDVSVDAVQADGTILYNLGKAPRVLAFAVRNGSLTSCDLMVSDCTVANAASWPAVGGSIVSLRAQYGRDTTAGAMDGIVDEWDQTHPANACGWARATGLRFVLVARSAQYESAIDQVTGQRTCEQVTTGARTWSGSETAPIDLSGNADWQCYRYQTLESVAPARNVLWMGQTGC